MSVVDRYEDLQNQLNSFLLYCQQWKLEVNIEKTKIVIFTKGRVKNNVFYYNGKEIEIVKNFKYLGVIFSSSGSFIQTKKYAAERATKAMYGILKKGNQLHLSLDDQLHLFDKIVVPILLYGCEVWGYSNVDIIERIHVKFCKLLFHLKSSTPNYMIYGELGRVPLIVHMKTRIIAYWLKIIHGKQSKYCYIMYSLLYAKHVNGKESKWLKNLKSILDDSGYSNIWMNSQVVNENWLIKSLKLKLTDQFQQNWESTCNNSSKGVIYKLFTNLEFRCQPYVNCNLSNYMKQILARV